MSTEFIIDDGMIMEYVGPGGDVIIPQGVTDIFFEVFYASAIITSITIPGSVSDIASSVFEKSEKLKVVKLCEGVSSISFGAFNECKNLEEMYLPKSLKLMQLQIVHR